MYNKIPQMKEWCSTSPKKNYINGTFTKGQAKVIPCEDPAHETKISEISCLSKDQMDQTVAAAKKCFRQTLKRQSTSERISILRDLAKIAHEHRHELAAIEAYENGKTYTEALNDDLPECSTVFDYYAGWVDKVYGETCPTEPGFLNYTIREPYGVCGLIVPWNFPLLMACWKIAPALAMGNAVIIKPSEHTSLSLIRFFELIDEKLTLPKGMLNLILGDGEQGAYLCEHSDVDKVSFTGSTDVGKRIVQASGQSNLKALSLELGGKSPCIFFEDTPDLEAALTRAYHVMFSQKGEKCTEPTRFLIHQDIYKKSADLLVGLAKQYKLGTQFEEGVHQGAQNNKQQFEKIMGFIQRSDSKLLTGGNAAKEVNKGKGYFVQPTIYGEVSSNAEIAQKEIFGPVLSLSSFSTEEEAIENANNSNFGLAAGLYTGNTSRAHRVAEAIEAGMVFVNRYGMYALSSPFGGFKQSGWGKELGIHSIDSYTKTKSIWIYHGS